MARRRTNTGRFTSTTQRTPGGSLTIVQPAAPARRSSGGGGSRRRKGRRSRGGARSSGGGGHSLQTRMQGAAIGGLGFGLLIKNFPQLPRIPGIGRSGTVALAGYFLKPTNKLIQDVCFAAAVIAGYSFGETGSISGDGDVDDVIASQA